MIVREVLEAQGRKLGWLAELLGVTGGHVSRLLSGERTWTAANRKQAALALGVPEGVLFGDGPEGARQAAPLREPVREASAAGEGGDGI